MRESGEQMDWREMRTGKGLTEENKGKTKMKDGKIDGDEDNNDKRTDLQMDIRTREWKKTTEKKQVKKV